MSELKQNYYGSLCTEMYEILHEQAPQDELDFYLSYAEKGKKILEKTLSTLIQRPVSFESGLNWFQPNKAFESGFTFPQ